MTAAVKRYHMIGLAGGETSGTHGHARTVLQRSFLCERERHEDADKEKKFQEGNKCLIFFSLSLSQGHGHGTLGACLVCAVSYKANVAGQCPVSLQLCVRVALFTLRVLPKQSHSRE